MTSSIWLWVAAGSLCLAVLPLALGLWNLWLYRAPTADAPPGTRVSILIPARNEEANISGAVRAALESTGVELEVIVLNDDSSDRTGEIVEAIAAGDPRVRLVHGTPLPQGWSGKQHANHRLSRYARHDVLLFLDADVRLARGAAARIAGALLNSDAALVSGVPRQETGSFGELLLVTMIHFLLLGYLPIAGLRSTRLPAFGAACGQLVAVRRPAYRAAGGHAAIRGSMHDGLTLPRALRRAGFRTDLFDATSLANCRMYCGWRESWQGFAKNATEGMAGPVALPIWTALLFGGHVLPWLILPLALLEGEQTATAFASAAITAAMALRIILALRFQQGMANALLHPLAVLVTLAIQWSAWFDARRGRTRRWRGRAYEAIADAGAAGSGT